MPNGALPLALGLLLAAPATTADSGPTVFDVRSHGAKGDGRTRDDAAIAATFAACRASSGSSGGREVRFPAPGQYLTGPWALACNDTTVRVEPGASVVSYTTHGDTRGWPLGPLDSPEPSQGLTSKQASPFISAYNTRGVRLTGGGTLDAGGAQFWAEHCGNWWCATPSRPLANPFPPCLSLLLTRGQNWAGAR